MFTVLTALITVTLMVVIVRKTKAKKRAIHPTYLHEARHAVVSFVLGKRIVSVHADHEAGTGHVENSSEDMKTTKDHRDFVRIAMAGTLAYNGLTKGSSGDTGFHDMLAIQNYIKEYPKMLKGFSSKEHFLYEMEHETNLLLKKHSELVLRFAKELSVKKTMNSDEALFALTGS